MSLARLQQQFLAALLEGHDTSIADPRGLRVYVNNYHGQLLGSLRDTYQRTAQWLGDEVFTELARAYIDANPSASWSLNAYGQTFPEHVARAILLPDPVAELAWLDNALRDAFYAVDVAPLTLHELVIEDWERAVFTFVPTLRFRTMHTNAPAIWSALASAQEAPDACLLPVPVAVRIWRCDLTPRFTSMPVAETGCLDLAMAGGTFGELCAWLAAHQPETDTATLAGQLLREWFSEGLVAALG
ncbi:MAG TPA: DNA-binding domain-containing protein [Luteibacter sp.]|jgi:hypothetical protein|uniref:DNA-binding domain-containing protein n=1 Tax=Luteibacter sp. TaxID=1886636 RepID=UPI002F41DBC0